MPYITPDRRQRIHKDMSPENAGELNYLITRFCQYFLEESCAKIGYDELNAVVGVLECVKQELYRRMVVPYENKKIEQNGDVY